jgi:hypothetical protein
VEAAAHPNEERIDDDMRNVTIRTKGNKVAVIFDVSKNLGPSTTGKTDIVASSDGAKFIGRDGIRITFSAFKPKAR